MLVDEQLLLLVPVEGRLQLQLLLLREAWRRRRLLLELLQLVVLLEELQLLWRSEEGDRRGGGLPRAT